MALRRVLVLFGRAPRAGAVKTRLEPALGAAGAVRVYREFLRDVVALPRPHADEVVLAVAPPLDAAARAALDPVAPAAIRRTEQRGPDLPSRLEAAFADELASGDAAVVVRNTDSPLLPPEREAEAFERLDDGADLVFGPDEGGGYYLVGMTRPHRGLFPGIETSSPGNLEATLGRARTIAGRVDVLATEPDVDTPADLERLAATLAHDPGARRRAPATAAALRALGRAAS
ncbi:MAG: DUF2064 domain-containing protein [Planctomycetota bacterium JB042]